MRLLTGGHRQGKTTTCRRLIERVRDAGFTVGGIVQPAVCEGGLCVAYDVVDVASGRSVRLAEVGCKEAGVLVGRFCFAAEGLAFGRAALAEAVRLAPELLVVDEVGPLELSGGGWAPELSLTPARARLTVLTVRRGLVDAVWARWGGGGVGDTERDWMCRDLDDGEEQIVEALVTRLRESH